MNTKQLYNMLASNIDKLKHEKYYKKVIYNGSNLVRFDTINRILIMLQNDKVVDLKTELEWQELGRMVTREAKPVYLLFPKTVCKYFDTSTNKEVGKCDLSPDELNKALEYNILNKQESVDELYVVSAYDVRDTRNIGDSNEYVVNKPLLNSSEILKLLSNVTGADIVSCDDDYYSLSDNVLYIKKKGYTELAGLAAQYITEYILSTSDLGEYEVYKDIISRSVEYSISSFLLGDNDSIDIAGLNELDIDTILNILCYVDTVVPSVVSQMKCSNNSINEATCNIAKVRKAELLLNLMESNYASMELLGK